jgi:predicted nucleic acid-binding Zn ribbon protein
MPVYVYRFEDGTEVEVAQGIKEDAHTELPHPVTRAVGPVRRVYGRVGVAFKGGGFYKTSNRSKETGGE